MEQNQTSIATRQSPSLVSRFAARYAVDPAKMLGTLKATCFKSDKPVTDEQMMALLVVADQHRLNPFTKEIYAFPDKGGIVPVVGVDGWIRLVNEHPQFDGLEFQQDDESCTCIIYRKDRRHPIRVTEYLKECKRGTQPWNSHPSRMMRHKSLIQCARIAFGFAGIYDQDEAQVMITERDITDEASAEIATPASVTAKLRGRSPKAKPAETVDAETGEISEPSEAHPTPGADQAEPPAIDPDDAFLKGLGG